jgi:hypothetical protein
LQDEEKSSAVEPVVRIKGIESRKAFAIGQQQTLNVSMKEFQ